MLISRQDGNEIRESYVPRGREREREKYATRVISHVRFQLSSSFFLLTVLRGTRNGSDDCYLESQDSGPVQATSQTNCQSKKTGLSLHQKPRCVGASFGAGGQTFDAAQFVQCSSSGTNSWTRVAGRGWRTLGQLNTAKRFKQQGDSISWRRGELLDEAETNNFCFSQSRDIFINKQISILYFLINKQNFKKKTL